MAARIKIIKFRIKNGKVQRRKKVSNVPGFRMAGARLVRMTPAERRRRKLGAKRAKIKRRTKKIQIQIKRKRSLQKRKRLGF
jgi:hypothetical protein